MQIVSLAVGAYLLAALLGAGLALVQAEGPSSSGIIVTPLPEVSTTRRPTLPAGATGLPGPLPGSTDAH